MNQPPTTVPTKKSGGCIKGCLIALAVLIVIAGIGGYIAYRNLGGWVRSGASAVIDQMTTEFLKDSKLPPEEQAQIKSVMGGLSAKIKSGEISVQQAVKIGESFANGPIVPIIVSKAIEAGYLNTSALPTEEKAAGTVTLQRFTYGVISKKISRDQAQEILKAVQESKGEGSSSTPSTEIKPTLTPEELRALLSVMKKAADDAQVAPTVEIKVDLSDELQKSIQEGLSNG